MFKDLLCKRGKDGIQLQVRHLSLGTAKQVCLCELGMLQAPHQQPGKHRWRSIMDRSSQGDTNTWTAEHVSVLSPDCSLCQSILTGQRRHFLMTVHCDIFYIRIYFCSDLLTAVVLHQDLRKQYVEVELPQRSADTALSCDIETPVCINLNWITFLTVWGTSQNFWVDKISYFKETRRGRAPGIIQIQEAVVLS